MFGRVGHPTLLSTRLSSKHMKLTVCVQLKLEADSLCTTYYMYQHKPTRRHLTILAPFVDSSPSPPPFLRAALRKAAQVNGYCKVVAIGILCMVMLLWASIEDVAVCFVTMLI